MEQKEATKETIVSDEDVQQLMQSLPKASIFSGNVNLIKYQGYWHFNDAATFKSVLAFQRHFNAHDTDLVIASHPKTGTTWLKSLLFAIVNRTNQNALLNNHPHELVLRLENEIYCFAYDYPQPCHLEELPSPRIFSTHLPYESLPESIRTGRCKAVYIGRNPLDTCVSQWHFYRKAFEKVMGKNVESYGNIDEYLENFYEGKIYLGPFLDHMLGYWKLYLEQPDKVLFLKYEDVKGDAISEVKKLAEFLGHPFTQEEEQQCVVENIVKLCSIDNLKQVKANKSGVFNQYFEKSSYFRKGEVGDWTNYFSLNMVERMKSLMEEKFKGSGLSFPLLPS